MREMKRKNEGRWIAEKMRKRGEERKEGKGTGEKG